MKRILITGANSYIGTSFEEYLKDNYPNDYIVDTIDMIDGSWRKKSFSGYDSVFHVAGIAHRKETKKNAHLYYGVNRDLAVETAIKAKLDGVAQFIFLSSMSIYGMETGIITKDTKPNPKSHYGKSKWQAEQKIASLVTNDFKACILRPPMVYGKGCRGNYNSLSNIALKLPVFPDVNNQRSMIYIENLCEFVRLVIINGDFGVLFPQNDMYVNTADMAELICNANGKNIHRTKIVNWAIFIAKMLLPIANKAFGSLTYDLAMSQYVEKYTVVDFKKSIFKTEAKQI